MSTAEMHERAAKRHQTLAEKARTAENDVRVPVRSFVRVVLSNPETAYHGMVGQVHSHNDLSTKELPNIRKEIGVRFSPGKGAPVIWFYPETLEKAEKPRRWDVENAVAAQAS